MRFPPGKIPHLIIEVTSPSNPLNDICSKAVEYAKMKVPQCVIVDRKNRCVTVHSLDCPGSDSAGSSRRRSARLSKSLPPSDYPQYSETQKFYGATVVRANVLEELALTAENLLKPKHTPTEIILSAVRKFQLERDNAGNEERDSKRERDDARNEEKEVKNKNMQLIALMKKRGIEVPAELERSTDDSSGSSGSSTASPERQRCIIQYIKTTIKKTIPSQNVLRHQGKTSEWLQPKNFIVQPLSDVMVCSPRLEGVPKYIWGLR
ncbi:unnamed protein product [Chondrus crispus]|uniref:Putative restriction endonuclease domain-containing protein n=1 Tax=Chondrus crispus TaxID=2769 RepID=R7Q807_CHOCR|nr:unnamed protein product [Chondrus crispus]CDF33948.1 unnamed protein product [Chondrus crispus]|eukprot:XP_005713767.1 unnamed protein product [Chondrus crispus]